MIYLQLFLSFLQVGMFSIGGGYAAIPLIRDQIVTSHTWLTMNEFTDLITIAEMTPGPIAVNSATFVGIRITGPLGAVIATLGCITPSLLIVSLLAYIYYRYKNVVALIAGAGLSILKLVVFQGNVAALASVNWAGVLIFVAAFVALRTFKINPILTMLCCGAANLFVNLFC